MILTEIQKQEVADYVKSITRYMETYDEVYDHLLSALEQEQQATFHISLAKDVINSDFGGEKQIRQEEENTRKALYGNFSKMLKRELLNTFQFPAILNNLALLSLGLIFYFGKANSQTIVSVSIAGTLIILLIPLLLFVYKSYILERKQGKPSVSSYALRYNALFGLNTATCVFYVSFSWDALTAMEPGVLVAIMSGTYFFLSVFLRAYLKMYNNALRLKLR
jgi:hypothetical protein